MSGGFVAYHLRQNKAIDRNLYLELLQRLARTLHISDYTYVGFAGPFSEDFKLAHSAFGIHKFISLETNAEVHKRQQWNAPMSCIKYRFQSGREFVDSYNVEGPAAIWLDYTKPRELGQQVSEIEFLVSKVAEYDVIKVTLNANPAALRLAETPPPDDPEAAMLATLQERLGAYRPDGLNREILTKADYPKVLLKAVEIACKRGSEGKLGAYFQLLTSFVYADSEHQMLTATGIILPGDERKERDFFRRTRIRSWDLATTTWGDPWTSPTRIQIPELSVRERLAVDQMLPNSNSTEIIEKLGFLLAERRSDSRRGIESYRLFYRHHPYLSRIVL